MNIRIPRWLLIPSAVLVASVAMAACTGTNKVSRVQQAAINQQQAGLEPLIQKQPPYFPTHSDERDNINERTARYADPNKISYITVLTIQGGILYHGVVKGKVSSVDSQVTPADGEACSRINSHNECGVVQIAEPDGSWGTNNPNAVFWFSADNVYHETTLPYFVSDQEQTLSTPPVLNIVAPAAPLANALPTTGKAG
jgi:hypothetical protein